jgi:polar amino acid transport system substrate-binding protein
LLPDMNVLRIVFILSLLVTFSALSTQPVLKVVTELSPPAQTLTDNKVTGTVTERVRDILSRAGIEGQFHIYPWARAFNLASKEPNTLIYAMARSPEREQQFQWIGKIGEYRLGLLRLASNHRAAISSFEMAKHFVTAVQREDVAVDFLRKKGFEEGKSLLITPDITASWELLLKGKVDFIIEDPEAMRGMLAEFGLSQKHVKMAWMIPELAKPTWLAASLNTDSSLVQRLRQASLSVQTR